MAEFETLDPTRLRLETMKRIEAITQRPLLCYVARTVNRHLNVDTSISTEDMVGFSDLTWRVSGDGADVLLVSNGGSVEAAERIVGLLRDKFLSLRFILPANAYSAATLMCLAADQIVMDVAATLGPIDPQLGGVPVRAILRGQERLAQMFREADAELRPVYARMIEGVPPHVFEMCRSAEALGEELARAWLSRWLLRCPPVDPRLDEIVAYFASYDIHKSHGRSILRSKARELLGADRVIFAEEIAGLQEHLRSLYHQYELYFDRSTYYKVYENTAGLNWGRKTEVVAFPVTGPRYVTPEGWSRAIRIPLGWGDESSDHGRDFSASG